jgi:translocator protein
MRKFLPLTIFLIAAFATAAFGAQFMPGSWYAALNKPSWNPPSWIFGPVWTVLYTLMAVSAWRVFRKNGLHAPIWVWFLQLLPNALWSYFFFGAHRMDLALIDICLLLCLIATTISLFFRVDRIAAYLLVPYFCWVSFASVLNWTLYSLN